MRSRAQFIESLRDERDVRYLGRRLDDVTAHPTMRVFVDHAASAFGDPPADLDAPWSVEEDGREYSAFYRMPRQPQHLLDRAALIEGLTRSQWAQFNIVKAVGSDALCALTVMGDRLGEAPDGTSFAANVAEFLRRCQDEDLATVVAQTDAKGDRSLRPGEQRERPAYLRIVRSTEEGIVVSGAKVHTTSAPVANELVILPTRAMMEDEGDFAVSFAIPVATKGITMVCRPVRESLDPFDNPVSARAFETETTTIFDDVLVPWDRVFLAGDTAAAGELARTFATFHRFTGVSYKPPLAELMLGVAAWIVEDNGLSDKAAVRTKLAQFVNYVAVIQGCRTAAAVRATPVSGGLVLPDPVMTNAGKHYFASNFHALAALCQDLAGGLVVTAPGILDIVDPETGPAIAEIYRGKGDDAVRRITAFNIVRDLTAGELGGYNYVASLHGEGSMNAQLLATLADGDLAGPHRMAVDLIEAVVADERLAAIDRAPVGAR